MIIVIITIIIVIIIIKATCKNEVHPDRGFETRAVVDCCKTPAYRLSRIFRMMITITITILLIIWCEGHTHPCVGRGARVHS